MATVIGSPVIYPPSLNTASGYVLDTTKLPAFKSGDYILVCLCWYSTVTVSDGGWGTGVTKATTSGTGVNVAFYYKKATGSTITNPTFTPSGATRLTLSARVIRYADATNFLDGGDGVGYKGVAEDTGTTSKAIGGMTTASNNCLLITAASGTFGVDGRFLSQDFVGDVLQFSSSAGDGATQFMGMRQQITAGATPTPTYYMSESAKNTSLTIAIRDDGSGYINKDSRASMTRLNWYGNYGLVHDGLSWSASAPNAMAGGALTTINGISVSAAVSTATSFALAFNWGKFTQFDSNENTSGKWVGKYHTFAATNLSGKLLSLEYASGTNDFFLGSEGLIVVFVDNVNVWAAFQLAPKVGLVPTYIHTAIISLENGTKYGTSAEITASNAIDWTNIVQVGFLNHRTGSTGSSRYHYVRNGLLHTSTTMVGGNATEPLSIDYLDSILNGWGYLGICVKQGDAIMANTPIQIGDGTVPTYYEATATLTNMREAFNPISQRSANLIADEIGVTVLAGSSDKIYDRASSTASGLEQNFTIHASSSTGADYQFSGKSYIRLLPVWKTGVPCEGVTFSYCGTVNFKGAAPDTITISNPAVGIDSTTGAVCSFDANGSITNSTISCVKEDGTVAGYHIALDTAVTAITLTDVTFSGTPGTDKVHVLKTTGTVTITISGTTSLAANEVTSEGATVSIDAPQLYQVVVVSGFTAGSRIQIYDTTNSAELFNGTASAGNTVVSGTTATWTDPAAAAGTRAIRVRVAYVSGTTAKEFVEATGLTCGVTSGTESITYPITPVADATYNTNAVDGSAVTGITFTDAATDLVNINIGGGSVSLPTIYAAFVYWIFTAAGIDDDVAYISAPDPANYILTSMKIRNTNATPLKVTGGYFYDSTGSVENCVDTAGSTGNIFPMPVHVVAYAVGSGVVTSQNISDIAAASATSTTTAVLAAAQTTPIHADIRKVLGGAIDGTGSDADPWGPV